MLIAGILPAACLNSLCFLFTAQSHRVQVVSLWVLNVSSLLGLALWTFLCWSIRDGVLVDPASQGGEAWTNFFGIAKPGLAFGVVMIVVGFLGNSLAVRAIKTGKEK